MTRKSEIDIVVIAHVLSSGTSAYIFVHYLLLPNLVRFGVSFAAYFYVGVVITGVLAMMISVLTRPTRTAPDAEDAEAPDGAGQAHPAE
jgi:hypothetical protein